MEITIRRKNEVKLKIEYKKKVKIINNSPTE